LALSRDWSRCENRKVCPVRIALSCLGWFRHSAAIQAQAPDVPRWFLLMSDDWRVAGLARERRSKATIYAGDHLRARKLAVAVYRPGDPCAIGGEPLSGPASRLDLAHDHVNGGYLGLACRFHNRSEGATRGNRLRGPLPMPQRRAIAFKRGRWQ
jgi:hypothetical protein